MAINPRHWLELKFFCCNNEIDFDDTIQADSKSVQSVYPFTSYGLMFLVSFIE